MRIGNMILSSSVKDLPWDFDESVRPFFHKGSKTGCLVMHGFTGTPATMLPVAHRLSEAGYTVYAPLLSGHGTTLGDMDGRRHGDWLNDALAAYDRLKLEGCDEVFLIGLSMGGLLMALTALKRPCGGLILLNTPFVMRAYLNIAAFISPLFPYALFTSPRCPDPYSQGYHGAPTRRLKDVNKLARLAARGLPAIACPVLAIQSKKDSRVNLRSVSIIQAGLPSTPEIVWLENSPHGCTYGPEKTLVADKCLEFIQRCSHME